MDESEKHGLIILHFSPVFTYKHGLLVTSYYNNNNNNVIQ